jgi:hemoglobin-like flavoprotein
MGNAADSTSVSAETLDLAKASLARCRGNPDFIPFFYETFFEACPEAKPMFAKTDFERQHKLLLHALGLLLAFSHEPDDEPNLLTRVAARHGRNDINATPAMYEPFVASLMGTIERHDPEFSDQTRAAWAAAVTKGIEYMKSKY